MTADPYLFRSERLGFRLWREEDLPELHRINNDPEVMKYFPYIPTEQKSAELITRMSQMFEDKDYCYFATDHLRSEKLIGFIGLAEQNFESPFTPCTDIGWRLEREYWHKGLATEGAFSCLEYGFNKIGLEEIRSFAPLENKASIAVMEKLGMELAGIFDHPKLLEHSMLRSCVCYQMTTEKFLG